MASPAHCFYCFECLSASFKGCEPPSLALVEELWETSEASKELGSRAESEEPSLDDEDGSDREDEDEDEEEEEGEYIHGHVDVDEDAEAGQSEESEDIDDIDERPSTRSRSYKLQLPSISRLQGVSSSSSSSTSTPSALSTSSSRSALTSASSTTSASPKSSTFFSQSRTHSSRPHKIAADTTYPLFVTWNTLSSNGHKSLRGCIGTFEAQELAFGLKSYALTSAFGDTRFSPITSSLIPSLSCSLTLLSSFETCSHALDWALGTHGLRISFVHRGRRYGATYLPDVALEQGWTKEETVESLMRKAGWDGSSGGGGVARRFLRGSLGSTSSSTGSGKPWDEVSDFKAVRYQGLKASASYSEWQEWRKWVQSSTSRRGLLDSGM